MSLEWETVKEYTDILFTKSDGIGRISINRPEVHNAFRPQTVDELIEAFGIARNDHEIGVILFTGEGGRPFAQEEINAFADMVDMSVMMKLLELM